MSDSLNIEITARIRRIASFLSTGNTTYAMQVSIMEQSEGPLNSNQVYQIIILGAYIRALDMFAKLSLMEKGDLIKLKATVELTGSDSLKVEKLLELSVVSED